MFDYSLKIASSRRLTPELRDELRKEYEGLELNSPTDLIFHEPYAGTDHFPCYLMFGRIDDDENAYVKVFWTPEEYDNQEKPIYNKTIKWNSK